MVRFPAGSRPAGPVLTGPTIDGRSFSTSSLAGQVVVINVWASWCEPCKAESPTLAALSRQFARQGVAFVGVDEADSDSSAKAFAGRVGVNYPNLADPNGSLVAKLSGLPLSAVPSSLVLDRTGRVAAKIIGPVGKSALDSLLRSLS